MEVDATQLLCLKDILDKFAVSIGLNVNFHKSQMVPINVDDGKMTTLASTFGCQIDAIATIKSTFEGG